MYNLIRKDFLIQKMLMFLYLFIGVVYTLGDLNIGFGIVIIVTIFAINNHYYDTKDNNNLLINSLPFTRSQIISSKYIGVLLFSLLTTVGMIVVHVVCQLALGKTVALSWENLRSELGISFILILLFLSFYFPFFYKFSNRYLLTIFSIIIVLSSILIRAIASSIENIMNNSLAFLQDMHLWQLWTSGTIISLLLFIGSWMLTIKIYANKDL